MVSTRQMLQSNGVNQSNQTTISAIKLLDLPQELIEKILLKLTFKEIGRLRLVNRRFSQIGAHLLNMTFQRLQTSMLSRFHDIKRQMPRRESARRIHHLSAISDIIETLHMRLQLLQMTFGKHVERGHICFFGGDILDEIYNILWLIRSTPAQKIQIQTYNVTDELYDLSTMAMEYFKEKIEPDLPEIPYFSADFLNLKNDNKKLYDLLDTSSGGGSGSSDDDINNKFLTIDEPVKLPQQSNMVLRKRIQKIEQGMKRYNTELNPLKVQLQQCKRKSAWQQRQLLQQRKLTRLALVRLRKNEKKTDDISRKFTALLQDLNKCKTELQYWRCKRALMSTTSQQNGGGGGGGVDFNLICQHCQQQQQQQNNMVLPPAAAAAAPSNDDLLIPVVHNLVEVPPNNLNEPIIIEEIIRASGGGAKRRINDNNNKLKKMKINEKLPSPLPVKQKVVGVEEREVRERKVRRRVRRHY